MGDSPKNVVHCKVKTAPLSLWRLKVHGGHDTIPTLNPGQGEKNPKGLDTQCRVGVYNRFAPRTM